MKIQFSTLISKMNSTLIKITISLILALSAFMSSEAETKNDNRLVGVVTDSITGERLGFVNVTTIGKSHRGVVGDADGVFSITLPYGTERLSVSCSGYNPIEVYPYNKDKGDTLFITLSPAATELAEVIVKKTRDKYSKKNNPAVDLMRRIRNDEIKSDPENEPYYSYDKYEKITLGLNDFSVASQGKMMKGKLAFLKDFIDTAQWTGKTILTLSLKEKTLRKINSSNPEMHKEIITGLRSNGIDKSFDQENIRTMLEDVLREINIFSNSIPLMQNRFVSPLSAIGADYYKYFITDTVRVGDSNCVELTFVPHTPESFGFNGKLYVDTSDSTTFVKRVTMRVPSSINLNYVSNIFISQNFEKDSLGNRHKVLDDMSVELQLIPGTQSFYALRQTRASGFSYDKDNDYYKFSDRLGKTIVIDESESRDNDFWKEKRMVSLSKAEGQMGDIMNRFRKVPFLYWSEKVLLVLVNGYIKTGSKSLFDIGPVNTMLSFGTVEGVRLRLGGMTTANLSKRWFGRGYVAYGFKDEKWKYNIEGEYSFHDKKYHSREFPMNGIRVSYKYDLDRIGQKYLHTNQDNIFLSFKRKESNLTTYSRLASLEYNLELENNFSIGAKISHDVQEATKWVSFVNGYGVSFPDFTTSSMKISLRYAPGEKYSQTISNRLPINMDAWIFRLSHEIGPKGFLGSDFFINATELSIQKRFWFSAFGYTDVILKGGKVWSQVPYPLLPWQNSNLSYTIQPESFSMLNPMEFALDQYVSLDMTYWMNGLIFNRIPYFKKLKLREVVTFKGFAGSLSRKNNPEYNSQLYSFPYDAGTQPMGSTPYMEASAGIDNIFTILRVDYVWRLTYRDMPGIDKEGLRIALHFSF